MGLNTHYQLAARFLCDDFLNETSNTSISVERGIDLSRLFPTASSPRFYRYNGSFTTPSYTEGITWIILERSIRISVPFNFRPPHIIFQHVINKHQYIFYYLFTSSYSIDYAKNLIVVFFTNT
jgi:hypothetical protein